MRVSYLVVFLVIVLFLVSVLAIVAKSEDTFSRVNAVFTKAYDNNKKTVLDTDIAPYPVAFVYEELHEIRFYKQAADVYKGKRGECDPAYCTLRPYVPDFFAHIKAVTHVPIAMLHFIQALQVKMSLPMNGTVELDGDTLNSINNLVTLASGDMRVAVQMADYFTTDDKTNLTALIDQTNTFVQRVSGNKQTSQKELIDFFHSIIGNLMYVITRAATLAGTGLATEVANWQKGFNAEAWSNVHFFLHTTDTTNMGKNNMEAGILLKFTGESDVNVRVVLDEDMQVDDIDLLEKKSHRYAVVNQNDVVFAGMGASDSATNDQSDVQTAGVCPHARKFMRKLGYKHYTKVGVDASQDNL